MYAATPVMERLDFVVPSSDGCVLGLLRLGGGMCRRGGSGMKVARTWDGIIIMAGPDPEDDICPLGVILRPVFIRFILKS
jgi:hypothetical protein